MEIIRIDDDPVPAARRAAEVLARGGIVLYPTDTLYGLAVDALNRKAIANLRQLKGRERKKPVSIVVRDHKSLDDHAVMHPDAKTLAEAHLPGGLTLVLQARPHIPDDITLNGQIGVRMPKDPFVDALAYRYKNPFTATSANRSGYPTPANVGDILAQFGLDLELIDLVVDAGERGDLPASTVVTFADGVPRILREGAISRADLGI
jgi:L-threonylcarbamoyladenylate synthase